MLTSIRQLRERWERGETTSNGWLVMPLPFGAEIASRAGFDSLCVDMQHGLVDYGALVGLLQATTATGVPTFVRVPWNEPSILMRALDMGAAGVIVPMVETAAEAERAVAACRYPPRGHRSFGPARAGLVMGDSYFTLADDTTMVFAMIETKKALDDLDAILDTPGLTGVYVGPADLSLSLGFPPETDSTREEHQEAIRRTVDACHQRKQVVGLHTAGPAFASVAAGWGVDFVTIATDASALRLDLQRRVAEFRASTAPPDERTS